jgi:hypothetical protein
MSNTAKRWVLMSVLSLAAFAQASASSITFPFNTVHSGATPGGPAPWATMTMTDIIGWRAGEPDQQRDEPCGTVY